MNRAEELKAAIQSGRCVLILGTGVSAAISANNPLTSWHGLLQDGIDFASASQTTNDREWATGITSSLNQAISADDYLKIGEEIVNQINLNGGGELKRWLRESIGKLEFKDNELALALDRLGLPIATTNYDSLFEQSTSRRSVTWRDNSSTQLALSFQSKDVIHLHGHWEDPDSIILTTSQYELMLADQSMNELRHAMAAINSMVYIGFGEGLSDPTFQQLRAWIQEAFPNQELHHYRLCLNSELDEMAQLFQGETIKPVQYGNSFSELASFLRSLAPAIPQEAILPYHPEIGLRNIQKLIQETALLSSYLNIEGAKVDQLLIPPVLLPIPHEQYVRTPKNEDQRVSRSDVNTELQNSRILIVGEENVGVSSALLWMNIQAAILHSDCIPLVIDYNRIDAGFEPLHKRIRLELRSQGIDISPNEEIPKVILTLDNLSLAKPDRWMRVAEELNNPNIVWAAMGCHRGSEIEILQSFSAEERERFHTLYVGRLNKSDVRALAKLINPRQHSELTDKAIELVRSQHLPSTPFTFSMILGALSQGESLMAATSTTTLLEAYVAALLGRGTIGDDSRIGLDAFGRTLLLSKLAGLFVERQRGELHQDQVVRQLQDWFDLYDWSDSPVDVLKDLQQRRVLLLKGATVSFSQTSYLHLFAAKLAVLEPLFLEQLVANPLYYAPILSHYASLKRTDQDLLRNLAPLIEPYLDEDIVSASAWNKPSEENELIAERKSIEASEQLSQEVENLPHEDDEFDPLDEQEEKDSVPFPLQPIEELPPIPRLITTLGLISNLLRDTEVITDQELRRDVLKNVLLGWAQLSDRIESEANFDEISKYTAARLADELKIPNKKLDNFVNEVVTMLPLAFAMSGISSTLSSQKLVRAVLRGMADGDLSAEVRTAVLGMYLLLDVGIDGWTEPLSALLENYGDVPAVGLTLRRLVLMAYIRKKLSVNDDTKSQEFLVDQMLLERYSSHRERTQNKGRMIEKLRTIRLKRGKIIERTSRESDDFI